MDYSDFVDPEENENCSVEPIEFGLILGCDKLKKKLYKN
jgi:hypothetical protein